MFNIDDHTQKRIKKELLKEGYSRLGVPHTKEHLNLNDENNTKYKINSLHFISKDENLKLIDILKEEETNELVEEYMSTLFFKKRTQNTFNDILNEIKNEFDNKEPKSYNTIVSNLLYETISIMNSVHEFTRVEDVPEITQFGGACVLIYEVNPNENIDLKKINEDMIIYLEIGGKKIIYEYFERKFK